MARPHVCFIQAQMLPWQPGLPGGNRQGVESKTLSRDDSDGSATLIVRYPAGWGLACTAKGDNGTRALFEKILVEEESHVDWLEAQLHQIHEIGLQNYLAKQFEK